MKKTLIFIGLILLSATAYAVDPTYTTLFSNKAIKGYDTVAYFTENKPVKGSEQFTLEYNGAQWLFSSAENKALFLDNPEKYAPQYGGYCAYAVAKNSTASIQPELFTIYNDKLYLNYNNAINDKWSADIDAYIEAADQNWPTIVDQ